MRRKLTLAAALLLTSLAVSGCRYGHPGNPSDHHHDHGHDGDHGHDHDHDH